MLKRFEYTERDPLAEDGVQHRFLTVLDEFEHHYSGDRMFYVREEYVTEHMKLPCVEYDTLTQDELDTLVLSSQHNVTKERVQLAKYRKKYNLETLDRFMKLGIYPTYVVRMGDNLIVSHADCWNDHDNSHFIQNPDDMLSFRNTYEEEALTFE